MRCNRSITANGVQTSGTSKTGAATLTSSRLATRHAPMPSSSSTAALPANQGQVGGGFSNSPASANSLSTSTRSASLYCLKTDLATKPVGCGNLNVSDSPASAVGLSVSSQVRSLTALTPNAPDSTRAIDRPWSSVFVISKSGMSRVTSLSSGGVRPLPVACNSSVNPSFSPVSRAVECLRQFQPVKRPGGG